MKIGDKVIVDVERARLLQYLIELERDDPFCGRIAVLVHNAAVTSAGEYKHDEGTVSYSLGDDYRGIIDESQEVKDSIPCVDKEYNSEPLTKGILHFLIERTRLICEAYEMGAISSNITRKLSSTKSCDIILEAISSATKKAIMNARHLEI